MVPGAETGRGAPQGRLPVAALLLKARGAVDGLIAPRLERHPRDATTLGTLRLEHLPGRALITAAVLVQIHPRGEKIALAALVPGVPVPVDAVPLHHPR